MNCTKCTYENNPQATYCSNCGNKIVTDKEGDYNIPIKNISFFFFALLLYIVVLQFTEYCNNYVSLLIADSIFAGIILFFLFFNYKVSLKLFRVERFNFGVILKILIFAPLLAIAVHFLANYLNQNVFNKSDFIYYNQFKHSPAPLLFSLISISVFPAIFEEMAFRGILFDESRKIAGLKPTIFITAILFTLLHLSLVSALWIFPLGLAFGYLRAKYRTLLYGMIGHFTYNTCILLIQIIWA